MESVEHSRSVMNTYVPPKLVGKPIIKGDDDSQIEFIVVKNDKSLSSMRNLIDLKNIIAK